MKVVGMLAWWDEPSAELYECVKSMKVLCDAVVAVDGAYKMTPGATRLSPDDQANAIRQAAHDYGLDCTIAYPEEIWTGQVAKRNYMLQLACQGDPDWLLAVDSDHRLVGERDQIRAELEELPDVDSIMHDFYTPHPLVPGTLDRLSPHPWHTALAGRTIKHSLLFRRLPEMRVEENHYGYSGIRRGQRIAIGAWAPDRYARGRPHQLRAPFRVDHVCFYRDQMRLDRNRDYCKVRDQFKDENGWEP